MSSISKLEEELLHAFYADRTLKKMFVTLSSLKVKLNADSPSILVDGYEIDVDTNTNESISFNPSKTEAFIDEVRTIKRDEIDEEDWEFLEMDLGTLHEKLSVISEKLVACIQDYLKKTYHEEYFLPYAVLVDFLEDEHEAEFSFADPVAKWTRAWKRLLKVKRNYLLFIGFTSEQLDELNQASFTHLSEIYSIYPKVGEVKEIGFQLTTARDTHFFSFFQQDDRFETKFFRSPSLEFEPWEGVYQPLVMGESLHEWFKISDEYRDQINDLLKEFIFSSVDIYYDALDEFESVKFEEMKAKATKRIGDTIVSVSERDGEMIYMLSDGTRLVEYK